MRNGKCIVQAAASCKKGCTRALTAASVNAANNPCRSATRSAAGNANSAFNSVAASAARQGDDNAAPPREGNSPAAAIAGKFTTQSPMREPMNGAPVPNVTMPSGRFCTGKSGCVSAPDTQLVAAGSWVWSVMRTLPGVGATKPPAAARAACGSIPPASPVPAGPIRQAVQTCRCCKPAPAGGHWGRRNKWT